MVIALVMWLFHHHAHGGVACPYMSIQVVWFGLVKSIPVVFAMFRCARLTRGKGRKERSDQARSKQTFCGRLCGCKGVDGGVF